jgi:hypothetical protein
MRACSYVWIGALAMTLAGCARFPSGTGPITTRELSFRIDFNGPINDNYFYFVPLDTTGGGDGPVPVFPGITTGEGWLTGAATHYVQYHLRQYTVFQIVTLQPFQAQPIGPPLRSTPPTAGGSTLSFTLDLNSISATGESVDANIIATDQPFADVRLLDGLGLQGTDFINLDITTDRTITNADLGVIELSGDVLDQNRTPQPVNEQTSPLDIVNFSITVDV